MTDLEKILAAVRKLPARTGETELALHGRISRALHAAHVYFHHEADLGSLAGRVDFLCSGGVAIEAKIGYGSRSRLAAQAERYLRHTAVSSLIVLSERRVPRWLAEDLAAAGRAAGKIIETVELARGVSV